METMLQGAAPQAAPADLIKDGTYEKVFKKYFNATPPASITDGTAAADSGTTGE